MRPKAIGYLRREISGIHRERNEHDIRALARRLGYDLARTMVPGPEVDEPVRRVLNVARRLDAAAVIVPGLDHINNTPGPVCDVCDLITVTPEQTSAKAQALPPAPSER